MHIVEETRGSLGLKDHMMNLYFIRDGGVLKHVGPISTKIRKTADGQDAIYSIPKKILDGKDIIRIAFYNQSGVHTSLLKSDDLIKSHYPLGKIVDSSVVLDSIFEADEETMNKIRTLKSSLISYDLSSKNYIQPKTLEGDIF